MKSLKFKVLNKDWKAKFLKDKAFYKRFDDTDVAVCEPSEKAVYFNLDHFSEETVRHELTHAFLDEMAYNSLELSKEQNEEFTCELVGKHAPDIMETGRAIFNHVKGQNGTGV